MNIPPQRGHGRPRQEPVDEEATSAPRALPPQGEPQALLEFKVSPMLQPDFFSTYDLKSISDLYKFLVCSSTNRIGSVSHANLDNVCSAFSSAYGQAF